MSASRPFLRIALMLALLAVPLILEAQPRKVYRLGHLSSLSPAGSQRIIGAFKQGLHDLGYVEGQNSSSSTGGLKATTTGCRSWRRTSSA